MIELTTETIQIERIAKVYYVKHSLDSALSELWVKLYRETGIRRVRFTRNSDLEKNMITVSPARVNGFDLEHFKTYLKANHFFVNRMYDKPDVKFIKRVYEDVVTNSIKSRIK